MTKKFENVLACGWSSDPNEITYGSLVEMGYLTKERQFNRADPYGSGNILWTVVGDIEFTDEYGHTFKQGDEILWEK